MTPRLEIIGLGEAGTALAAGLREQCAEVAGHDVRRAEPAVAEVVEAAGARFAGGAVMAAVPPHRHTVPVLLSGTGAEGVVAATAALALIDKAVGDR